MQCGAALAGLGRARDLADAPTSRKLQAYLSNSCGACRALMCWSRDTTADDKRRAAQDFAPTNVSVNGAACTLSVVSDIDAPVPELPGAPAVDEILQPVSIRNSTIYGIDGQPLNIQGINWCVSLQR